MAKKTSKYHAVAVGRKPGLYTEWNGYAEEQISGIKKYNWAQGHLGTDSYEAAVAFLKEHTIRKVTVSFLDGTEMTFEQMLAENPLPPDPDARKKPETPTKPASQTHDPKASQQAIPEPEVKLALDPSRISRAEPCERVNRFCETYGYSSMSVDQRRAIQAVKGKFLLFAVPGSGKTTVLLARTGYMVHACNIPANQIMSMTFTRAAAAEMKERYAAKFPEDQGDAVPQFRTIHSFCLKTILERLRTAGFQFPKSTIDEERTEKNGAKSDRKKHSQRTILAEVLKKNGIRRKAYDESVQETVGAAISSVKNRQMTPGEYGIYSVRIDKKDVGVAPLYETYQAVLARLDCMDYDDMLIYSLEGLRRYPQVLEGLRRDYRYWSIDEAQDNSLVQHDLMTLLAGENGNLFMVGDDDQSIYSFRGAVPRMLLEFGNRPDVTPMVMGMNYRSGSDIVLTAKAFIEQNENRADKEMRPSHTDHGLIRVPESFFNEVEQYAYIVETAKARAAEGKTLGVLYQLNASALPLVVYMHRSGVDFEASRSLKHILNTSRVGDILCTLRFALRNTDFSLFEKLYRFFDLYYLDGKGVMDRLRELNEERKDTPVLTLVSQTLKLSEERAEALETLSGILAGLTACTPSDAVRRLVGSFPDVFETEKLTERLELYGLLTVCDLYSSIPKMLEDLDAMTEKEERLREEEKRTNVPRKPPVSLSTIHSAKGRQWDHVMIIDSFDEVFPGEPQEKRIGYDPEEAARLFYVAATRAIACLDILTVSLYHGSPIQVSRFISDFAYEADKIVETPVENYALDVSAPVKSTEITITPSVYYGVQAGRKPGVYTRYDDVLEQVEGYPGNKQKKFATYAEAWAYVFPGKPLPVPGKKFACAEIQKHIQRSGGAAFNYPMDLPEEVRKGFLRHFRVPSLLELSQERARLLRRQSDALFTPKQRTDYHGRTDAYSVVYMPANFYKVWMPLWKLLSENNLPQNLKALEFGPGPGTTTWSVVSFYKQLAVENPEESFSLDYTAVEYENDFRPIFETIQNAVREALPANLKVKMNLIAPGEAISYIRTQTGSDYDLILESNMFNAQETFIPRVVTGYLGGLRTALKDTGYAILIEPRENKRPDLLTRFTRYAEDQEGFRIYARPTDTAVNISGIRMIQDAKKKDLRYSNKPEHAFSWTILQKPDGYSDAL